MHGVRPRMSALELRNALGRRRQRDDVVAVLRHRDEPALALLGHQQRLGARIEHAVAALELGAVDGQVGLVDQLVGVGAVAREAGDADRDRRPDRLARGLDVVRARRDRAADPLGDLEGLLRRRLGQQDRELLAAEARRHVVVAQVRAEHFRDALQHRVAREVAVGVVDVAQQVEVRHHQRQRPFEALGAQQLLVQREREVPRVEETRLRVDARLLLQLRDAQRAVDQQQRGDRERDQPGVRAPERRHRDAEHGEHEVGREAREREEARLAQRVPAREVEHRGHQQVVDRDDRGGCREAGERVVEVAAPEPEETVEGRVGGQHREGPVADVEDLDVPGGLRLLSHSGMCMATPISTTSSGGSSIAAGIRKTIVVWYDWFRGVRTTKSCATAAIVPRMTNVAHPGVCGLSRDKQRQCDGGRDRGDDEEVDRRLGCELRRVGAARLDVVSDRARDGAHALSPARVVLGSKLVIGPLTVSSSPRVARRRRNT